MDMHQPDEVSSDILTCLKLSPRTTGYIILINEARPDLCLFPQGGVIWGIA